MPDPIVSSSDSELQARIERVLASQYEVVREIGRGGMGIVYLGRDLRLKRLVAIKLLPPELAYRSEIRTRFLKEAETAAQLSHPNIVPIFSVDEREGLVYFVMGFVDGQNLGQRLHQCERLDGEDARRVLREVADALSYAHARGVIHRDIKPDNILMSEEDGRVMVTDFGIARAITEGDSRLTATGMAIGTPAYMSPEQSAGDKQIDGRSDLYSLGVVGYQMLAGEPPFVANSTPALLVKHISEMPTPVSQRVPDVPPDLASIVMRLLEKDPARRFEDATEVLQALDSRTVQAAPEAAEPRAMASVNSVVRGIAQVQQPLPNVYAPTEMERERWNLPEVVKYRRRVVFYVAVNAVFLVISLFGGADVLGITMFWTVLMAYWYARLWTEGYDWRDVFKQPRDRLFFDMAAETVDDARALFDKDKRHVVRERERARMLAERTALASSQGTPARALIGLSGPLGERVRTAFQDRDDVARRWNMLPASDRQSLPDFSETASQLADRAAGLAQQLSDLERAAVPGALERINAEIEDLEAQANPHEGAASEQRIRRLAFLKRDRRAAVDRENRRDTTREKLESCLLALRNLRLDLSRMEVGSRSYQQVTTLVEHAQQIANDMDGILSAEREVSSRTLRPSAQTAPRA
ncbi:MAG TPA: serine/threonine-protein kinase [Gemmatimonadales bacterium]|nr:serine/threonine-protein kinase [Gemmatimonadales bacterium]